MAPDAPTVSIVKALTQRLSIASGTPSEQIEPLEHLLMAWLRTAPVQSDLAEEGGPASGLRVILSGWASRYKLLANGRRQLLGFLLPGDICDAYLHWLSRMDHSIGALTDIVYAEVKREEFDALVRDHPAIARALWIQTLLDIAAQREWTVSLGQRVAFQRLAHLFLDIHLRLRGVGLTMGNRCDFPATQIDIGDAAGLSPVHVNRTLQHLRAADLVDLRHRRLHIRSVADLRTAALLHPSYPARLMPHVALSS